MENFRMTPSSGIQVFDFSSIPGFIHWLAKPGADVNIDPSTRLRRILLITIAILMSFGGILWGTLAVSIGAIWQASIPYGYVIATILNLSAFRAHRNFFVTSQIQLSLSLLLPFVFQWSLGGGRASGAVMLWGILALVGALLVRTGKALLWIFAFILLAGLSLVLEPVVRDYRILNESQQVFALTLNVCIIMSIVFGIMVYFIKKLDYSEYLESLVNQRTLELRNQLETTRSLLNGMKQAVFAIDHTGRVVPPVSAATPNVLGKNIEDRPLVESILEGIPKLKERRESLEGMVKNVFLFDRAQWLTVEEQLPRSIQYQASDFNFEQSLKVNYSPLWDHNGAIDRILFVVEDISDLTKLERKVEKEKLESEKQSKITQEITSSSVNDMRTLFKKVPFALTEIRNLAANPAQNLETLVSIIQILHRLKGEAHFLRLKTLAGKLHEAEDHFADLKQQVRKKPDQVKEFEIIALLEIELIEASLREHYQVASRLLGVSLAPDATRGRTLYLEVPVEPFEALIKRIREARAAGVPLDAKSIDQLTHEAIGVSIEDTLERLDSVALEMADRTGKLLRFSISAEGVKISPLIQSDLNEALFHIVRNCVDHGIESPEERMRTGKAEQGRIRITAVRDQEGVSIVIKDDGRGIPTNVLVAKAVAQGFLTASEAEKLENREKLKLVFARSLSSKEQTTEYSGRGMGMDIARNKIQAIGGTIEVFSTESEGTEFRIRLPG